MQTAVSDGGAADCTGCSGTKRAGQAAVQRQASRRIRIGPTTIINLICFSQSVCARARRAAAFFTLCRGRALTSGPGRLRPKRASFKSNTSPCPMNSSQTMAMHSGLSLSACSLGVGLGLGLRSFSVLRVDWCDDRVGRRQGRRRRGHFTPPQRGSRWSRPP